VEPQSFAITDVPITSVRENPDNPRTISDDQFQRLVKSIREFPEMLRIRPLVVDAEMVVLGGNMRLRACREAGLNAVPVIRAAALTPAQRREFVIKDNASFGAWDWDALANEWSDLPLADWGVDVPNLEPAPVEGLTDPDAVPDAPKEPRTRVGDIYALGEHRLICGDSTDPRVVTLATAGTQPDTVVFDPPFERADLVAWTYPVISESRDVFVFGDCINDTSRRASVSQEWQFQFVWDGVTRWVVPGRPLLAHKTCDWFSSVPEYDHERVKDPRDPRTTKERGKNKRGTYVLEPDPEGKCLASVFKSPVTAESHGAEHSKPVLWLQMILGNCSSGAICDLFAGSGTSLIAAELLNRRWSGIELNPAYCDVIVARWEAFTGRKAVTLAEGEQ
jgi:hypothetical protein